MKARAVDANYGGCLFRSSLVASWATPLPTTPSSPASHADSTLAFAAMVDAFCVEQEALRGRLSAIGDGEPQTG